MSGDGLTYLGLLGKYYSLRHELGHYRSSCVSASYSLSWTRGDEIDRFGRKEWIRAALERSLQSAIKAQSGLRYGISDMVPGTGDIEKFMPFEKIYPEDVIEYIDANAVDMARTNAANESGISDGALTDVLEASLSKLWPKGKPAWKMIVLEHDFSSDTFRIDISFFAHHAIADGMSGVAFHRNIAKNLEVSWESQLPPPTWPLIFDSPCVPPSTLDDHVDREVISLCKCSACQGGNDENHETGWGGMPVALPSTSAPFLSRVKIISIPAAQVSEALKVCKILGLTLTGLLHGLICVSLARQVPEAEGFRSVTPFSVRHYTNASNLDIVNHISYITSSVPKERIFDIGKTMALSPEEFQYVIQTGLSVRKQLVQEVDQFPHGSMFASISRVQNVKQHFSKDVNGQSRSFSYELSNLGAVEDLTADSSPIISPIVKLEKLVFAQGGMVIGPAIGFSCVSVRGGPLIVAITWQHGIVPESLLEGISNGLVQRFQNCTSYV